MKKENLAVGGVIGVSLLIGACCLGPALFLVFGVSIGALGMLAFLEPYRPLFVALGGGALAYAAWRAWMPAPSDSGGAECVDESCAPNSKQRRRMRLIVTFVAVIYGLAIVYPHVLDALL